MKYSISNGLIRSFCLSTTAFNEMTTMEHESFLKVDNTVNICGDCLEPAV